MTVTLYVVRLGGKLYVQSPLYNLYQATTKDICGAHFFKDIERAERMAKKARGEVVALTLSYDE